MLLLLSYFHAICGDANNIYFLLLAVPEPVAFYPLNARYKAAEKENRQTKGTLADVAITNGPYNEPGGAYMFYGTVSSYIEFPNKGGLDTRFSITLMCWVQSGGQDGPLFSYGFNDFSVYINIGYNGKLINRIVKRRYFLLLPRVGTAEVLPAGKWIHVAASYDHNSGNNSLYVNGQLRASQNIGTGYEIATFPQKVRMGTIGSTNGNFKGKIAEMKVYNVALNEAQIQTSIRQGRWTFLRIVVPLPSPMNHLINENLVGGQLSKR